jgi:membrane-associated phospholipid phosphatase
MAPACATLLASTNRPLTDVMLARLDQLLFFGFDRNIAVDAFQAWPHVFFEAATLVYHSLAFQPYILLAALFMAQEERRAWTMLMAWKGSLLVIVAVFPFFPALGTPPYSLDFLGTFEGARNGSLRLLGVDSLTGIITFPSFHAAAAVLLGWGFSSLRGAAPIFVPLNVLMFFSALLVGGHYLVDLVAGGAVAAGAILFAERAQKRIEHRTTSSRSGSTAAT